MPRRKRDPEGARLTARGLTFITSKTSIRMAKMHCDEYKSGEFTLILNGGAVKVKIPGKHKSKSDAMDKVFTEYDFMAHTVDLRGWD